jgi:hypothetical protein
MKKESGPARGKAILNPFASGTMLLSPQCHPADGFALLFDASGRAEGQIIVKCRACGNHYARILLGRIRSEKGDAQ